MRGFVPIAGAVAAVLLTPAAAGAAEKPAVFTGGVANVQQNAVVLNGWVNPRGAETTYFFQYGTTRIYGATTPPSAAGAGTNRVRVAVTVAGLTPLTRYHYRLVAQNASGMTVGGDRTFRTLPQPRGLTLAGTPNPVPAGGATTLGGAMTGSGDIAGRQVLLQANPYPYTQGFVTVSNILLTNPDGSFAFPVLSVPVNTQYRVLMPQRPDVVSPTVVLGTTVTVTRKVRVTRFRRSGRLRFTGRIMPAIDGHQVLIQKLGPKGFYTIGRTFARDNGDSSSRYVKRVRQRRGGRYRVVANINAQHVPSGSRSKLIRRVRRR